MQSIARCNCAAKQLYDSGNSTLQYIPHNTLNQMQMWNWRYCSAAISCLYATWVVLIDFDQISFS